MDYIGLDNVTTAINYSRDFNAGNVKGRNVTGDNFTFNLGRLPEEWAARYREDYNNNLLAYVVTSYGTPIAWVTYTGKIYIPDVKYSVSTTRHQNLARSAYSGYTTLASF